MFVMQVWPCLQKLSVNSINQLSFVMVKCGILFGIRSEILNVI
jgi:hypothetical protein